MARIRTICRAALLLAPCLLLGVAAPPARSAFSGRNGRILVEPNAGGTFTMNPDGLAHTPVNGYAESGTGSLSADSRRQVYAPGGTGVKVRTLATGDEVTIEGPGPNVSSPVFSPDGTQVAWMEGGGTVMRAPADGSGAPQPVVAEGAGENFDRGIAWTPDGTEIVIGTSFSGGVACSCSELQVIAVDVATGDRRAITPLGTFTDHLEEQALQPDVAGDGSKVVFLENISPPSAPSFTALAVAPLTGGSPQALKTSPHGELDLPRFSPDGSAITYVGSRSDARREIRALGSGGGGDHLVDDAAGLGYGSIDSLQWLPEPCVDTDGDALCDDWETDGLDVDDDGVVDVDLPAMGAHADHKDVFLEIDAMPVHEIEPAAVDDVVKAFAAAPLPNPDGSSGITLHVDNGATSVMDPATGATWGTLSDHDTLAHDNVLGTETAGDYDWTDFDAIKATHFDDARRPVFHYVVGAHQYGASAERSSGISRGIGAADLIVSLGPCQPPGGADCNSGELQQAGTLMHELGHNLGLQHGGDDAINRKPTYLSIMNYAFQFGWLKRKDNTRVLDYNRFTLSLDESALDEQHGWGVLPASGPAKFFTIAKDCAGANAYYPLDNLPFDFDCDNVIGTPLVTADMNGDGLVTKLRGPLDWPRLVFNGGGIGSLGAPAEPGTTPLTEPPYEELVADARAVEDTSRRPHAPAGGAPGPAATPSPPAATPPTHTRCTLKPQRKVKRGRVRAVVRCDRPARVRLGARLKLGRSRLAVKAVRRSVRANRRTVLTLRLPRRALRALARHGRVSATFTLRVPGERTLTRRVARLKR